MSTPQGDSPDEVAGLEEMPVGRMDAGSEELGAVEVQAAGSPTDAHFPQEVLVEEMPKGDMS